MSSKRKTDDDVSSSSDSPHIKKRISFDEPNDNHDGEPSSSAIFKPADETEKVTEAEDGYFRAYADLLIHQEMIDDQVRTNSYRRAILQNYQHFFGKVVLDVGCGTGILSLFCVQAGARKVYAVDASPIVEQARRVVRSNKLEGRIVVIHGKMEEVDLPEQVDVIVSEWMGYMLLYENMLPSVLHARDKWLKKNGMIFPNSAQLFIAPITDTSTINERIDFWERVREIYKVDLGAVKPFAKKSLLETVHVQGVSGEEVQAHACLFANFDLTDVSADDIQNVKGHFDVSCFGHNVIHGFVIWFTVTFPGGLILSTSPYDSETHWVQTVLYIEPFCAEQDTLVQGTIVISPNGQKPRFLDLSLQYQINGGEILEAKYFMNEYL